MEKMSPESTLPGPQSSGRSGPDSGPWTLDSGLAADSGLRVKELAESLGVSKRFVYQMRARGFSMRGKDRHSQTATVQEAQDWIKANNFRLVKGVGVIG